MKRVLTLAVHGATPSHANDNARVTVFPASGSQDDTFTFTGSDFEPGEILAVVYQDPSGEQYTYAAADGAADILTADDRGNWVLSIHPDTDFAGAYAGTWTVAVCSESGQCWSGTIDIAV